MSRWLPGLAKALNDLVGQLDRSDPTLLRCLFDLLSVLIRAGQEVTIFAPRPVVARERVGRDRRVRVTNMWNVVYVVDGCRDVEAQRLVLRRSRLWARSLFSPALLLSITGGFPLRLRREHRFDRFCIIDVKATVAMIDADAPLEHVELDYAPFAGFGDDSLAELGQALARLGVRGLFVNQAALEAATLSRHLGWIENQALVFGVLDRDRNKCWQPRRTAELAAARADATDDLGLVAHTGLAQFDATAELARQFTRELALFDFLFGREVDREPTAAAPRFNAKDLHGQTERPRALFCPHQRIAIVVGFDAERPGLAKDFLEVAGDEPTLRSDCDLTSPGRTVAFDRNAIAGDVHRVSGVEFIDLAGRGEFDAGDIGDCFGQINVEYLGTIGNELGRAGIRLISACPAWADSTPAR